MCRAGAGAGAVAAVAAVYRPTKSQFEKTCKAKQKKRKKSHFFVFSKNVKKRKNVTVITSLVGLKF